jgi:hypothetical protein
VCESDSANWSKGNAAGKSRGDVVTPPRKSLPLAVSHVPALPQGPGWAFVVRITRTGNQLAASAQALPYAPGARQK